MKEVKSPKKPLIYYYGVAILVIFLFNMIVSPLLMKGQNQGSRLWYFYEHD